MPRLRTPASSLLIARAVVTATLFALLAMGAPDVDAQMRMSKGPSMLAPKGPSLLMPSFDSARGRKLFANQGCVICHSVNGVGGTLGPPLDATTSVPYANPFDFAARMWRGADAMITLQEEELGYQIELDGEALAHITAFAHDLEEQRKFSDDDIPALVKRLMDLRKL